MNILIRLTLANLLVYEGEQMPRIPPIDDNISKPFKPLLGKPSVAIVDADIAVHLVGKFA